MVDGGARAPTYAVISVIKIGIMFGCMVLMTGYKEPSLRNLSFALFTCLPFFGNLIVQFS